MVFFGSVSFISHFLMSEVTPNLTLSLFSAGPWDRCLPCCRSWSQNGNISPQNWVTGPTPPYIGKRNRGIPSVFLSISLLPPNLDGLTTETQRAQRIIVLFFVHPCNLVLRLIVGWVERQRVVGFVISLWFRIPPEYATDTELAKPIGANPLNPPYGVTNSSESYLSAQR